MRFMFLVKTAHDAPQAPPPPELFAAMHALAEREVKAGRMVQDGGLMPPQPGREVRISRRKLMVVDGPFAETKEVIGGYAVFELPDHEAALASAMEFLQLHQQHMPDWEGSLEIREVAGSQVELIRAGGGTA
jgi:hypothetical protein